MTVPTEQQSSVLSPEEARTLIEQAKQGKEWVLHEELPAALQEYEELYTTEDPEEEPYRSKYKARKILEDVLLKMEKLSVHEPEDAGIRERRAVLSGGKMIIVDLTILRNELQ